ncbi:hypothetical protein OESDEN_13027, partial [Oesophagostomum dentatum]
LKSTFHAKHKQLRLSDYSERCSLQIYDCKLEFKAIELLYHPETEVTTEIRLHRVRLSYRFPNRRKESPSEHVLEMAMETTLQDEGTLRIMINPNATRYGCMGKPHASDPRLLCIYDNKFVLLPSSHHFVEPHKSGLQNYVKHRTDSQMMSASITNGTPPLLALIASPLNTAV